MADTNYWEKRQRKWIDDQIKGDKDFQKQIQKYFDKATENAQNDINQFYMSYAKKENITMEEAIKRVKDFDVQSFKKQAKKMVKEKDFSDYANERLRLYNATMRINRLEMLKSKLGLDYMEATQNVDKDIQKRLTDLLMNEAKNQAGILNTTIPGDIKGKIKTLVNASYKGATFSERLWVNQDELKAELDSILTRSFVMGQNPVQLGTTLRKYISDSVKNKVYVADRIARTEAARVAFEYRKSIYKDQDVKKVKWISESTACKICLPRDDNIYDIDDVPEQPAHANCRCSIIEYYQKGTSKSEDID